MSGCRHFGLATEITAYWEADYDENGSPSFAYAVVTLNPSSFICNVCGLNLDDASELKAAGLPESINIEKVDEADFYEEPDYS